MKPKLFIGSSKESLNIAYAIQNNLKSDAEVTVWDQGVFVLSTTIIESLINALNISDFGIFIFSPDDLLKIKKRSVNKARDNVVFELGVFLGKLGRNRSFLVIPENAKLSLPSDLLGFIYGVYDTNRSDGNTEAALGPACNQIRNEIVKLGPLKTSVSTSENKTKETLINNPPDTENITDIDKTDNENWIEAYFHEKDYGKAIALLTDEKKHLKSEDQLYRNDLFITLSKTRLNPGQKDKIFSDFVELYKTNVKAYVQHLHHEYWDDNFQNTLVLANKYLTHYPDNEEIVLIKIDSLLKVGMIKEAVRELNKQIKTTVANPTLLLKFISIAEVYHKDKLKDLLHYSFIKFPNNEQIIAKYYKYFETAGENEKSLFLINRLYSLNPSAANSCLKGNILLNLNFLNAAMDAYMKAVELSERKESWILANIGNLFKNQSFFSEAIKYLEEANNLNNVPDDYALNRMSAAVKLKKDELEGIDAILSKSEQSIFQFYQLTENFLEEFEQEVESNAT